MKKTNPTRRLPTKSGTLVLRRSIYVSILCVFLLPWSPTFAQETAADPHLRIDVQDSSTAVSLRGIVAIDERVAWASGEEGTVLRTVDGGAHWSRVRVASGEGLDFRSLAAFDAQTAMVVSAGSPAMVFRTTDGGQSWKDCYRDDSPDVFADAIRFSDRASGWIFGDPLDGRLFLLRSTDGGIHWKSLPAENRPVMLSGEAGFAASGSSLATIGDQHLWIGLGGGASDSERSARVLYSTDGGKEWGESTTPLASTPTSGIFSLVFWNATDGVAVGGDFKKPEQSDRNIGRTSDGGKSWRVPQGRPPAGYRSSVVHWKCPTAPDRLVCVGSNGGDISEDQGESWQPITSLALHAVDFAADSRVGWAIGPGGRMVRLQWVSPKSAESPTDASATPPHPSSDNINMSALGVAASRAPVGEDQRAPGTMPFDAQRVGRRLERNGDEISVCGQLFHTATRVVLWTDPEGYDAYRVERRFAALDESSWDESKKKVEFLESPNRYGMREGLTADQIEQVRGGGWTLPLLQKHVDQFVIHYDVCGTSRQCFKVLHDVRGLSVHFMLDIDGTIYQTLDLKERARHATISNARSIGIEIANIGAYSPNDMRTLDQWYRKDSDGTPRITLPSSMGDGGVLTKGFVGRPLRLTPVRGNIQNTELVQYDLTRQQYDALFKLTATLCTVFPQIRCDYPRDDGGRLIPKKLDADAWEKYQGLMGHYHVQSNKTDPGPAFQWEMLVDEARKLMGPK